MMAKRPSVVAGINMDRRASRASNVAARKVNWQMTHQNMSVFSVSSTTAWSSMSMDQQDQDSEVMTQLHELNKDADDTLEFVCGVNQIVCTTPPFIFILIGIAFFEVMSISAGVRYLEDCPCAPKIPVFLFVGGCVGLLKAFYTLHSVMRSRRHPESGEVVFSQMTRGTRRIVDTALNVFLCAWQLAGTVWVFSVWRPNFSPPLHDPDNWCPKALYMFAFVEIIVFFGMFVVILLYHCGVAICYNYTTIFEG